MMKILPLLLLLFCTSLHAQPRDLREGNADYVVPVPVALAAMQERAAFLEPSSVREASFGVSWMNGPNGVAVGAEFAPAMIGGGINLSDYLISRYLRPLIRARLSFAVVNNPLWGTQAGIGLRL